MNKSELRAQQAKHQLLSNYLPTLQLKKALLQVEVSEVKFEIAFAISALQKQKAVCTHFSALMPKLPFGVKEIKKRFENIAGVEIAHFEEVIFEPFEYELIDTPAWTEGALSSLQQLEIAQVKAAILEEKKEALEKEFRDVSIRVNLFEKILIPRAEKSIKKIRVFLGDQQLAAVSRAKVAKSKIKSCAPM